MQDADVNLKKGVDMNEIESLQSELKVYKEFSENVNAEKIALDQLLVESLKNNLSAKKELILLQSKLQKLESEKDVLNKEKESLKKELDDLKSKNVCNQIAEVLDNAS